MIKIKVNRYIPDRIKAFLSIVTFLICAIFAIYFMTTDNVSELYCQIFITVVPFYFVLFPPSRGNYVTDILIDEDFITIIRKKWKKLEIKKIERKKIKSFFVHLLFKRENTPRGSIYVCKITIKIKTYDENTEEFTEEFKSFGMSCPYRLLLDLIKVRNVIPNFSYKISSCDDYIEAEIKNFEKTGKKFNIFENVLYYFKTCNFKDILAAVIVVFGFVVIIFGIFLLMSPYLGVI